MSKIVSTGVMLFVFFSMAAADLPTVKNSFGNAFVKTEANNLLVSTGSVERVLQWTGKGFVTIGLKNLISGKEWVDVNPNVGADWSYAGLIDNTPAELLSLYTTESTDEGFTSPHIEVVAEIFYPSIETTLKYQLWVYPDAPGIYSRIWLKGKTASHITNVNADQRKGISIELVNGRNQTPYLAQGMAQQWYASIVRDEKCIQYHIKGLDQTKNYKVGLSWWSWDGKKRIQKLRAGSVDGEAEVDLIPATVISNKPSIKTIDLPTNLAIDNTIRIYVDKIEGEDAQLSELWIYEEGKDAKKIKNGIVERVEALHEDAPAAYHLSAYADCGEKLQEQDLIPTGRVDFLPCNVEGKDVRLYGYYNDTQHRNFPNTPIYKEKYLSNIKDDPTNVNWANAISIEDGNEGVIMLKESHKCVNQYGVDTGEFGFENGGVTNTGTGLYPEEVDTAHYKWAWGSWMLVYNGGEDYRELAVKTFDRYRFPVRKERDMYIMTLTWGHSLNARDGRNYAWESSILNEIPLCAEMGIDLLLIDDGWQVSKSATSASPTNNRWRPHEEIYPEGWTNVIREKKYHGIDLGLWGVARAMEPEDMIWNWDQIHMKQLKLDFASFPNHDALDEMMQKARKFMLYTNHKSMISWDLTENAPRYGYYWAREYGNLHFMNRKPTAPANVTYIPWTALRDYWMLSRYNNLNKFQLTSHNPRLVDKEISDAYLHGADYAVATTLMGVPQLFCMPRNYNQEEKNVLKEMFNVYKSERDKIWDSYVFPIGDEPDNMSYTGFQTYQKESREGHFLIFRELNNKKNSHAMKIRFCKEGDVILLRDLFHHTEEKIRLKEDLSITFEMDAPASYRFYEYEVLN